MEGREGMNSGVTVKGEEAPESYRVAARSENPNPNPNPNPNSNPNPNPNPNPYPNPNLNSSPYGGSGILVVPSPPVGVVAAPLPPPPGMVVKKKRGRPRKYGPDGKPSAKSVPLSPMPISASIPMTGEFSAWKRGRGKPVKPVVVDSVKKQQHKLEFESPGERVAYSVGANFTPHVITVNTGEDVTMKILSFSQQGSRAICILSANGSISNVTLRQPSSSGGTLTYEGRFEILSLTGSYLPTENGGTKSRSGGMSVSLAGPDGRVVGGGLAGLLVAAGPVQVVIGSFLPGHQQEQQKPKKQKVMSPSATSPPYSEETDGSYGGPKPTLVSSSSFRGDTYWPPQNTMHGPPNTVHGPPRSLASDNTTSIPESKEPGSQSKCEVSC